MAICIFFHVSHTGAWNRTGGKLPGLKHAFSKSVDKRFTINAQKGREELQFSFHFTAFTKLIEIFACISKKTNFSKNIKIKKKQKKGLL